MPASRVTSKSPWHIVLVLDDSASMEGSPSADVNEALRELIDAERYPRLHAIAWADDKAADGWLYRETVSPPLAPSSSPEQPESAEPEVIGRYEAEGTAYVMYADGSIDAQSEQGILRFHSLAELKAFFQS